MSSPRKFSEKIALLQQKTAEGDAEFNTILNEVKAFKQTENVERRLSLKNKFDVSKRKCETLNGPTNCSNPSVKIENNNGFDRLTLPLDNSTWRSFHQRTHSDSSIPQTHEPNGNSQQLIPANDNYQSHHFNAKIEPPPPYNAHHFTVNHSQYQPSNQFDCNNNHCTMNSTTIFQQTINPTVDETHSHNGNTSPNVLMIPQYQYPRSGGSLPNLCFDNHFCNELQQQHSYISIPQHNNNNGDLYMLEPQQQVTSNVGPLKQVSNIRRRHSPIGDAKPRRHSPSPECSPRHRNFPGIEPQSPQSQSSYSPQNSPHFLSSPVNELTSLDNSQQHNNLSMNFDQITLENNFISKQTPSLLSSSSQLTHHHSLAPTSANATHLSPFIDDLTPSYQYCPSTNLNIKSPTIPNITFTDVDSSKTTDFANTIDHFITDDDFQLVTEDFLLNTIGLNNDMNVSYSNFSLER